MKVTVCQLDPRPDHSAASLAALKAHVADTGSDFLLLPEMCFSTWLAADPNPDAARWREAVAAHDAAIADLGALGVPAIMGTRPIVNAQGSHRNEAFLWSSSSGEAAPVRQKYYLPDEPGYFEHRWYDRGEKRFDVARAGEARIGVQICTEMWFFEWARHYGKSRADLLCVPRATPHSTRSRWIVGGQTSAICSGAYSLSSNLWAPEGAEVNLGGMGWVIDPDGTVLAQTDEDTPFATVEVDLQQARAAKAGYPRYVPE